MSGARDLLGRLRERVGDAAGAMRPARAQQHGVTDSGNAAPAKAPPGDVQHLLKSLNKLSTVKQVAVCELWPGPEIKLDNGVTVTARSKKERRRFTRPIDAEVLEWLGGFAAGDTFYDIGANCGSLTLAAGAMHGDGVKIVAIEPGYANFESLARNLSHNGMLGFVIPLQVALLDRTRLEPINYYRSTAAGTSLHAVGQPLDHEDNEFTPVETQMVATYALDDLIDALEIPEPTHVKVDVDGTEGPLLQGATKTLARGSIKELLVEIVDHDRAGTRLSSVQSLMDRHGYRLAETFSHHVEDNKSFVADHLFRRNSPGQQTRTHAPKEATRYRDGVQEPPPDLDPQEQAATAQQQHHERKARLQGPPVEGLRAARKDAAKSQRVAERAIAKLEHQREVSTAKLARVQDELDQLRRSYHLSGVAKKLDLREIDGFSEIADEIVAAGRTGMHYDRLYTLWQAVRAAPRDTPIIEIGSYFGGSARFIAEALQAHGSTPRFYVCDTFAGHEHTDPEIDTSHHGTGKFEDVSAEATAEYLSGYPALELVVGDIVETSAQLPDEIFGLVHLDVDVYPTTAFCLRFFGPRLADDAIMVIDDYGFVTCPGVKQAADEFVAEFPQFRLWHLLTGQAILLRLPAPRQSTTGT